MKAHTVTANFIERDGLLFACSKTSPALFFVFGGVLRAQSLLDR